MFKQTYHILSDIHLEHNSQITSLKSLINVHKQLKRNGYSPSDPQNASKILIMAGDIGYPTDEHYWLFLRDCANIYKHVICIPGNHEYYNQYFNIDQINSIIQQKSLEIFNDNHNFHYLNNSCVTLNGIKYIGTTLWSQLNPIFKRDIVLQLNDFNYIKLKHLKKLTFDEYNNLHQRDLAWLTNEIETTENSNFVVITHHLPSSKLNHPKYKNSTINSAFSTNLDHLIKSKLWIAGHTHTHITKLINNTNIVVNPLGYINECKYCQIYEITIDFD